MRSRFEKARDMMSTKASGMLSWAFTERTPYNRGAQHDPSLSRESMWDKNGEMYGLMKFISSARNCKSREEEDKLINKELAKIRKKFQKKTLDGYSKRKYVCKLLFIFLMGRNVGFGYLEALSLLSSNVRREKQMGYLFLSILFNTNSDTIHFLIRCIKSDLESNNWECMDLALKCIGSLGNKEMARELSPMLLTLLEKNRSPTYIMQSVMLGYLKLYRADGGIRTPELSNILRFLTHEDLGMVHCATTLIDALIKGSHDYNENEIVRMVVTELWRLISHSRLGIKADHVLNRSMPEPWLLMNLLKLLQNFSIPKEPAVRKMLNNVVDIILVRTQEPSVPTKEVKKCNVRQSSTATITNLKYAVFFETISVITQNTDSFELWSRASQMMDQILSANLPNLKYMAFEMMARLAISEAGRTSMKSYTQKATDALKNDIDVSIQHKAANFLYSICDQSNADFIVGELLAFLLTADYTIKESIALQVAIIADHWQPSYFWYVDAMFKLISISGDFVDDQVYSKVIRTVTNIKDIQKHATNVAFHYLKSSVHSETLVRLSGFLLGEFGYLIHESKGSSIATQWKLLQSKFTYSNNYTKATLLSSFIKIAQKFPEMRSSAVRIFTENAHCFDAEIQSRSVEYLKLLGANIDQTLLSQVFQGIPPIKDNVLRTVSQPISSPPSFSQGDGYFGIKREGVNFTTSNFQPRSHDDHEDQYPLRNYFEVCNDEQLKINMKSQYRGHSGELVVTYINKKQSTLTINVHLSQQSFDSKLELYVSPMASLLDMGKEVEQMISIKCFGVFNELPTLDVSLWYQEKDQQRFEKKSIKLPIYINNFLEPVEMRVDEFVQKWNTLETISAACQQQSVIVKDPKDFWDIDKTVWKLGRFNIQVIELESTTMLGAATFVTKSSKATCLLKLNLEESRNQFHLTMKSSDPSLTTQLMKTLRNVLQ